MSFYNFKCSKDDTHATFTVSMLMSDYDEHSLIIKCPQCGSGCHRVLAGEKKHGYIRGNCYLDAEGARRDMNKFTLQNDDPYGYMRQEGEVVDMINRLEQAAKISSTSKRLIDGLELYKVCPSCKATLHHDLFQCGSKGRCVDCTPSNERIEYKSQYEKDKEWLINLITNNKIKEEEFSKQQKDKFKEEFGVDVDKIE